MLHILHTIALTNPAIWTGSNIIQFYHARCPSLMKDEIFVIAFLSDDQINKNETGKNRANMKKTESCQPPGMESIMNRIVFESNITKFTILDPFSNFAPEEHCVEIRKDPLLGTPAFIILSLKIRQEYFSRKTMLCSSRNWLRTRLRPVSFVVTMSFKRRPGIRQSSLRKVESRSESNACLQIPFQ